MLIVSPMVKIKKEQTTNAKTCLCYSDNMTIFRNQPWQLVLLLGAFALIRPAISILGVYDSGLITKPTGPVVSTMLIAVVWITAAIIYRVKDPIKTLALAGVAYSILAIALNIALNAANYGDAEPIPIPGLISMIVFEAIFGAICGLIALGTLRLRKR